MSDEARLPLPEPMPFVLLPMPEAMPWVEVPVPTGTAGAPDLSAHLLPGDLAPCPPELGESASPDALPAVEVHQAWSPAPFWPGGPDLSVPFDSIY